MLKHIFILLVLHTASEHSFAQCGANPVSGTTTISTADQVVNSYFPGTGNPVIGATSLTVGAIDGRGSATGLSAGDLVLIIQMQGADVNATNNDAYGDGIAGGSANGYLNNSNLIAGYYEYNTVAGVAGSVITFSYSLANNYYTRSFAAGSGSHSYQLIRVPRYYDLTITGTGSVTAPSWNGSTGGIVVLDAANIATINGTVDVSAKGFRGGGGKNFTGATAGHTNGSTGLTNTDYRWNSAVTTAANLTGGAKGESFAGTPVYVLNLGSTTTTTNTGEGYVNGSMGRSAPANGGGGGTDGSPVGAGSENQFNTGGGGGGNAGAGGNGGSGWHGGAGSVATYPYGGHGGSSFAQASIGRFAMGGGGGAGTANNSTASNEYQSSGGAGGGIVIIRAKSFAGSGAVNANGGDAPGVVGVGGTANTDAAGGGGAGGTIVLVISQTGTPGLTGITANAGGGKGGDMTNYYDHGPGGGGGGGIIYASGTLASSTITGGLNGKTRTGSTGGAVTNDFGATAGSNGSVVTLTFVPGLINRNNLASPCGTLPVTLLDFYAVVNNNLVNLYWRIDQAINFSHFQIEYSLDGNNFLNAGNINYINGRSSYDFTHANNAAIIYYRLKLLDLDGTYSYSKTIVIKTNRSSERITVYPNPTSGISTVQFKWTGNAVGLLKLTDGGGRVVYERLIQFRRGDTSVPINIENLPGGLYTISVEINKTVVAREKLVLTVNK